MVFKSIIRELQIITLEKYIFALVSPIQDISLVCKQQKVIPINWDR